VLLELAFAEDEDWERFRALPVVTASLDATPDPVNGLYVYPGRGGSAGDRLPRRKPRPSGSGAAAMPIQQEVLLHAREAEAEPPPEPLEAILQRIRAA